MIQVLIISSRYSQTQHLRRILSEHSGLVKLCGTADNSVLGKSLIEALHPDVVIMPVHMTFWNPEDLIAYLLPRGTCPMFILLPDGTETSIDDIAAARVQQILPTDTPTGAMLLRAIEEAVWLNKYEPDAADSVSVNRYIQHSLEVMELIMGLSPVGGFSQSQLSGKLNVGNNDCWIILGFQSDPNQNQSLFSDYSVLEAFFSSLEKLLRPLGSTDICVYQEQSLCILLEGKQESEPEWNIWAEKINELTGEFAIGSLIFDISDAPMPSGLWHDECHSLLDLQKLRFFFSPLCLQPKIASAYRVSVSHKFLLEKLSALSASVQYARQNDALIILRDLQDMVSHSMSDEICAFVATQFAVQMYSVGSSFGVDMAIAPFIFGDRGFSSVEQLFDACRDELLSLFSRVGNLSSKSNSAIDEVCRYIEKNLSEQITLTSAAEHVHINSAYLSRVFKKETGQTFTAYVNEKRILRAMQLLQTKDRIIDIAGNVGFENSKYFSQVFKKQTGMTPLEYRSSIKNGALE